MVVPLVFALEIPDPFVVAGFLSENVWHRPASSVLGGWSGLDCLDHAAVTDGRLDDGFVNGSRCAEVDYGRRCDVGDGRHTRF